MQDRNYWKRFESTGRIEDYLAYRSHRDCPGGGPGTEEKRQEGSYAGIRMSHGAELQTGPYGGI